MKAQNPGAGEPAGASSVGLLMVIGHFPALPFRFNPAAPRITTNSAFAGGDEIQQEPGGRTGVMGLGLKTSGTEILAAAKESMVELFQFEPLFAGETRPPQANRIQAADSIVATRYGERRQVLADGGTALHQRQRAHRYKLVDKAIARNEGAIGDRNMASEQSAVGQNDMVAHLRVMADVTVRHQKVV